MKKVNKRFIGFMNLALAALLSALGFGGCDILEPRVEYGTPNADYAVKGKVVDKASGKAIKGIYVGYQSKKDTSIYRTNDDKTSVLSNDKGEFSISINTHPRQDTEKTPVYIEDIDGEANGLYQSDTLYIDFKNAKQTAKGKSWYEGEFTVDGIKVELKEIGE